MDEQIGIALDMAIYKMTGDFTREELDNFNMDLIELACKYDAQIGGAIRLCDENGDYLKRKNDA